MTATIKQITEALGANPSTVSRALSDHPQIADATRDKVLSMAEELHYTPNLWAQNLVGTATNLIGCLVQELSNPFYIPMVRAIEDVAKENDYIIFIGESRHDLGVEKHVIDKFRRVRASGLIITPVLSNLDHLSQLERMGVAVVIAGRDLAGFDAINMDNVKTGRTAGRHLSASGYKRIAYIQSGNKYNIPFADYFIVPLSTIAFPKFEMGRLAMQILLQRITKMDVLHIPKHFALEPDLVIRRSC